MDHTHSLSVPFSLNLFEDKKKRKNTEGNVKKQHDYIHEFNMMHRYFSQDTLYTIFPDRYSTKITDVVRKPPVTMLFSHCFPRSDKSIWRTYTFQDILKIYLGLFRFSITTHRILRRVAIGNRKSRVQKMA